MEKKLSRKKKLMVWLGVLWGTFSISLLLFAFPGAPPVATTGGFGEGDCTRCHIGTVNSGPGSVTITVPEFYTSGDTFPIRVTVSDPDQRSWGFEISARIQSGPQAGRQAGNLMPGADDFSQLLGSSNGIQYIGHTKMGTRSGTTAGSASFDLQWQAPDVSAGPVIFHAAGNAANNNFAPSGDRIYITSATLYPEPGLELSKLYYFPHIALGEGWQTTLTYVNYLTQAVTCETSFFSDFGDPLVVPFFGMADSERTDNIPPGGTIHEETAADPNATGVTGWARAQCSGPVQASALFRLYQDGAPQSEASVVAMTEPASRFVTFADQDTGVAYANPSAEIATITFTGKDAQGTIVGMPLIMLAAGEHGATSLHKLPGLESFTGSVTITSSVPIISLSLNFEAYPPAFSSLPPGQLGNATAPLPNGGGAAGGRSD